MGKLLNREGRTNEYFIHLSKGMFELGGIMVHPGNLSKWKAFRLDLKGLLHFSEFRQKRLTEYKQEHGHCNVPRSHSGGGESKTHLGNRFMNQRDAEIT